MSKKRKNQSRTLPSRQCKKARTITNLRKNRNGINYDESGSDILDYIEDSELIVPTDVVDSPLAIANIAEPQEEETNKALEEEAPAITVKSNDSEKVATIDTYKAGISSHVSTRSVVSNSGSDNLSSSRSLGLKRQPTKKTNKSKKKETIFIVDKVLEMRVVDGVREFFLKWEGFPDSENSWEPEHYIDSKDIITEYLEELERHKPSVISQNDKIPAHTEDSQEIVNGGRDLVQIAEINKENNSLKDGITENVLESINENKMESINEHFDEKKSKSKKKKSKKKSKRLFINKIKMKFGKEMEINANIGLRETLPAIIEEVRLEGNSEGNVFTITDKMTKDSDELEMKTDDSHEESKESEDKEMVEKEKGIKSGSSQSNKENNIDTKAKYEGSDDDNAEAAGDNESDDEDYHADINDAKSELSDEDFNAESRKNSKMTQNNLNAYFPENLPQTVQEIFQVEKILRMRWSGGIRYFFLRWEGFPDSENSWEPEGNLECPELIEEFLNDLKKPIPKKAVKRVQSSAKKQLALETLPDDVKIKEPTIKPKGFPKSREPEVILGSGIINDELNFLIKWKNVDMANLVPAKRANIECPQTVIRFYESNLSWQNMDGSLTTEPKEKLTVEEETDHDRRARIEAKKGQRKSGDQPQPLLASLAQAAFRPSPRKVGRPSSMLQSRKLASGASRMLNLINNFQSRQPPIPVGRRPLTAATSTAMATLRIPMEPPVATSHLTDTIDAVAHCIEPLAAPTHHYESRDIPRESSAQQPDSLDFPEPTMLRAPSLPSPATTSSFGPSQRPLFQAQSAPIRPHLYSSSGQRCRPQSSILSGPERSLQSPQMAQTAQTTTSSTGSSSKQQLHQILVNSLHKTPPMLGAAGHKSQLIQPSQNTQPPPQNTQPPHTNTLNQQLQQILASSFQNSSNMTLNQQLQHILANQSPKTAMSMASPTTTTTINHNHSHHQPHQQTHMAYYNPPLSSAPTIATVNNNHSYQVAPSPVHGHSQGHSQGHGTQYVYGAMPLHNQGPQTMTNQNQVLMYQGQGQSQSQVQQYAPIQYQYMAANHNNYQSINHPISASFQSTPTNQMFFSSQTNASSPRSILPRMSEFSVHNNNNNNPMPAMLDSQTQAQTQAQQNNQIIRNSYLNLGAYL